MISITRYLVLFILIASCSNNKVHDSKHKNNETVLIDSTQNLNVFVPEAKDTIIIKTKYGEEKKIRIGSIEVDSVAYEVYTIIRTVGVADDVRINNLLIFRNEEQKIEHTFNLESSKNLPVDTHVNQLVFTSAETGECCFEQNLELFDMLCLSCLEDKCFPR